MVTFDIKQLPMGLAIIDDGDLAQGAHRPPVRTVATHNNLTFKQKITDIGEKNEN